MKNIFFPQRILVVPWDDLLALFKNITSVAKAMKVLRKLRCLQIEVGIVQSLCRNDCHQVILLGQVLEIVE